MKIQHYNGKILVRDIEDPNEVKDYHFEGVNRIEITENDTITRLVNLDDFEDYMIKAERRIWRKHVDPKHYKGYVENFEWLDTMRRIPTLRDPDKFIAAIELQVRKYLDRRGQKDHGVQELQKALFYLIYGVHFLLHGNTSAEKVHKLLAMINEDNI
jgi:hypothetical protein